MRALACTALILALTTPRFARAQVVVWQGDGADCPDAAGFSDLLARERGSGAARVDLQSTIVARKDGSDWVVAIDIVGDEDARRVLRAPSCAEVASAAALYLSLVLDGIARRSAGDAAPAPAELEPSMGLAAGAVLDVGSLPAVGPGAELRYWWRGSRFALASSLAWYLEQSAEVADDPRFSGDFGLSAGAATGCVRTVSTLWGCAGFEAGVLSTTGRGAGEPLTQRTLWLAGLANARVSLPISRRVELVGGFGTALPLRRKRFEIQGVGSIHQSERAAIRASLAIRIGFNLTDLDGANH